MRYTPVQLQTTDYLGAGPLLFSLPDTDGLHQMVPKHIQEEAEQLAKVSGRYHWSLLDIYTTGAQCEKMDMQLDFLNLRVHAFENA